MPERIQIALDGTPLAGPPGGIRRFLEQLYAALPEAWPEAQFSLWSDQLGERPQGWNRRWWSIGLPRTLRRHGVRLFHGVDFAVPYWPTIRSVITIHDLSPWREPSLGSERVRRRAGWLLRAKIPRMIHTPSEAVRLEVHERFGWPLHKIVAIPHAAASHLRPNQERLWARPYVLYVGTLEERKNLGVAIEAARTLWAEGLDFDLVLAGQCREGYTLGGGERVFPLGFVPEDHLPCWYAGALFTIYPSRYEGFGLPVLEAMQCASPVLAAAIPVLRESGGEAALYASPGDPVEWVTAMRVLLLDSAKREQMRKEGLQWASNFSWQATAQAMRRLYESCLA